MKSEKIYITPMIISISMIIGLGIGFIIKNNKTELKNPKKNQDLYLESLTRSTFYLNRQFKFINEGNFFMAMYYDSLLNREEQKRYVLDSLIIFEK